MDQLRVAVIGLGIGRRHIQAYQSLPGVEVVAIVSPKEQTREKVRQEFGIRLAFSDLREALARADIELVSICSPDRLHAEQGLLALEAGKHVLCEKPLATTLEEVALLTQKVKETGLKFMVAHNYRFMPQFGQMKQLVEAGVLGEPFYGESSYIQDLYFMEKLSPDYWRLKDPQDFYLGGAIHNVDLLRWLIGEVEEVHSYGSHAMPFYPLNDNYISNFWFTNGRMGRLLLLLGARLKDKFYVDLSVYGPEGSLKAVMQRDELIQNMDKLAGDRPTILPTPPANSFALEIAHFVECVREDKQPAIDVVEGAKAVAICLASIRSAQERKPVRVDYSFIAT